MNDYVKAMRLLVGHAPLQLCGASVIIYKGERILLQLRTDNRCWGYFGGSVELGEVVEEAAKRELLEESGLVANELTLFNVYSGADMFYTYPNGDQASIIDIVYTCNDFSGDILAETSETSELKWFLAGTLPENVSPPVARPLNDFARWILNKSGSLLETEHVPAAAEIVLTVDEA